MNKNYYGKLLSSPLTVRKLVLQFVRRIGFKWLLTILGRLRNNCFIEDIEDWPNYGMRSTMLFCF